MPRLPPDLSYESAVADLTPLSLRRCGGHDDDDDDDVGIYT